MKTALLLAPLVFVACSKTAEPESSTSSPTPPAAQTAKPAASTSSTAAPTPPSTNASDLVWDTPAAWKSAPNPSQMRKATFVVPRAPGDPEDADVSVSQVGGGVDANIKRWGGQFQGGGDPKVTSRMVGPLKVTIVEAQGTFTGGGMAGTPPSGPKPSWALLAAIVDATDPPYFFKMTGPQKTVAAARGDFDRFVASFHTK